MGGCASWVGGLEWKVCESFLAMFVQSVFIGVVDLGDLGIRNGGYGTGVRGRKE